MFHFIVKFNGWESNRDSLSSQRIFEYTNDNLNEAFKPNGSLDINKISSIPAIFASESGGRGEQVAKIGNIYRLSMNGTEVHIEYSIDQDIHPLPNSTLEQLSSELHIEDFEFSRSHWAIKEVDLYHVLLRNKLLTKFAPKVFSLTESPIVGNEISVMMPFDSRFDEIYQTLKNTCNSLNLSCSRADDIWENDAIIQDVVSLICRSIIVICDCTGRNANVFYEAGIAHALGKDVILITQSNDDIPFDLRHLRYLHYLNNNEGRNALSANLAQRINTILS